MLVRRLALCLALTAPWASAGAIDLAPLWDYGNPQASEERFRAALAGANADDTLILQTQIARTFGLRADFKTAQAILESIEPATKKASAEVRVRYALEYGRTLSSAVHGSESQTPAVKSEARQYYLRAYAIARAGHLDGLAIDALHMMAFVDTAPADQLQWDQQALDLAIHSSQPAARHWEASLRNNTGYALHELGRYQEALVEFQRALVLEQQGHDVEGLRAANWMVAWTLRALNRPDEALAIQLRLEQECDASGTPAPDVYEELEILYREKGDEKRADEYRAKRQSMGQSPG